MITWLAATRLEVVYVALPPLRVPVPSTVDPSVNVTVPVAVMGDTVAVNVTDWPYVEVLLLELDVNVVVVAIVTLNVVVMEVVLCVAVTM